MRIKFTRNASYIQNKKEDCREYKEGEIHDLPDDHANRWLRRNAAVVVETKKEKEAPKQEK